MKNLIGKRAIRTAPANGDWSYSSGTGVLILNITDTHIYIQSEFSSQPYALNSRWMDGNWVEYSPNQKSDQLVVTKKGWI